MEAKLKSKSLKFTMGEFSWGSRLPKTWQLIERKYFYESRANVAEIQQTVPDILVWQKDPHRIALRCFCCGGTGRIGSERETENGCGACGSCGWIGLLPDMPATSLQAQLKVPMLQARYAAGISLWNPGDYLE